jgi:hypothetical protein
VSRIAIPLMPLECATNNVKRYSGLMLLVDSAASQHRFTRQSKDLVDFSLQRKDSSLTPPASYCNQTDSQERSLAKTKGIKRNLTRALIAEGSQMALSFGLVEGLAKRRRTFPGSPKDASQRSSPQQRYTREDLKQILALALH